MKTINQRLGVISKVTALDLGIMCSVWWIFIGFFVWNVLLIEEKFQLVVNFKLILVASLIGLYLGAIWPYVLKSQLKQIVWLVIRSTSYGFLAYLFLGNLTLAGILEADSFDLFLTLFIVPSVIFLLSSWELKKISAISLMMMSSIFLEDEWYNNKLPLDWNGTGLFIIALLILFEPKSSWKSISTKIDSLRKIKENREGSENGT